MMDRRRFLTISAAAIAVPCGMQAATWQGQAFGADVSLTIRAPRDVAEAAIARARAVIADVERLFSLYDPASDLVRLNDTGRLDEPDARFVELLRAANDVHRLTDGRFDPTVQPLWRALALGEDAVAAEAAIGWDRVRFDAKAVALDTGQALTFNGIAQGFATDLVTEALEGLGLTDVLVNIGEYRGLGGPWKLGISDPVQGLMGYQTVHGAAVATSSPRAMALGERAHILHPRLQPRWATVSVTAETATLADGLSTGLVFADRVMIAEVAALPQVQAIRLVDLQGDLIRV